MRKRQNFSQDTRVRRYDFAGGKCESCGCNLEGKKWHADHDNADGLTGQPTFENCRILCIPCHAEKTKGDVKTIAKAKSREAYYKGATLPKRPIPSRPFPKVQKARREQLPMPERRPMYLPMKP